MGVANFAYKKLIFNKILSSTLIYDGANVVHFFFKTKEIYYFFFKKKIIFAFEEQLPNEPEDTNKAILYFLLLSHFFA